MIGQQLTLKGLQKRYGAYWALQEVNLLIQAGEFISIVGPSGSGKTTLLTLIAGFEMPTAGAIHIGQQDVTTLSPNHRNIGMVFQRYALFPHMTVRQNIAFPLRMRKIGSVALQQSRIDEMLQLTRLQPYADRYPHQLSGGQQQRVAVARALAFNPPVILMDEPLGALDKKLREAMQFEIKSIQESVGATVVYVTHDQDEALTMSDRVGVMRHGRLEQIGAPIDLYCNPATAFVADFVGNINFIPASILSRQDSRLAIRVGPDTVFEINRVNQTLQHYHAGASVKLAIRPEHVHIDDGRTQGTTKLHGTVETVIFSGAVRTALVRLSEMSTSLVRVQVPTTAVSLPERGQHVSLNFSMENAKLFNAEDGAQP